MSYSLGLEALVDAVGDLYRYRQQKTLYECSQIIRRKKQELSEIQHSGDAEKQRIATVELHKCRFKLENLKKKIETADPEYKSMFEDLLKDLEERISLMAGRRKVQRPQ